MKKIFFITLACFFFCSPAFAGGIPTDTSKHDSHIIRDGSSYQNAIIIMDTTESAGVSAEYKWLDLHYPGYSSESQALSMNDHHPYDILSITTKDGTKKEVYFDISNYFGKW